MTWRSPGCISVSVPPTCVFHFKSEGGKCVVVVHFAVIKLSKSMYRSFPKGLGELSRCLSVAFNIRLSFLSKEWVTGGFCGVRLSSAPVCGVAALQVEFF